VTCSKCKTENEEIHKYCYQCGISLKEDIIDELLETRLTEEEANHLLRFSYVFEINNLIDEAIEACTAITEIHPEWADVHFKLGRSYEARGFHGKAIAEYRKAISINENYIDAHRCLGELYSDEGFYNEAIEQFNIVLNTKIKFDYADIYNYKGLALEKLGKIDESIEEYKKALEINPDYNEANYNIAKLYQKKKFFDLAFEHISKAIKGAPRDSRFTKLEEAVKQRLT